MDKSLDSVGTSISELSGDFTTYLLGEKGDGTGGIVGEVAKAEDAVCNEETGLAH
jgi:hypothetical protein